ncbi:hypothetical protein DFJ63DRAFT_307964 [Scheffersomyces coipomensis]|uniref:uncharacterized protein n=1 Tax=Scheffersomyces coipomensis TaxID=1788519 RepID=UPI00315DEEEF
MPLELEGTSDTPIDDDQDVFSPYQDLSDLRVSLIGNKDLKFKLVGDIRFIKQLVDEFNSSILTIISPASSSASVTSPTSTSSPSNIFKDCQFLQELEKRAVIINILCSFITEVNTKKYSNITICLESLEKVINPIIELLNYFIRKFITNIDYQQTIQYQQLLQNIENLMNYCLDIFLSLSNIRNHNIDSEKLWRFITSLLIITDYTNNSNATTHQPSSLVIDTSLLIKSLKLIPILLSANRLSTNCLMTLITAVLKRLSNECNVIIDSHFPQISQDTDILHQLAFEDVNLPNIELNKTILKSKVNLNLLVELMTCTAQIFSYSKQKDYSVLLTSSSSSSSSSKISAVVLSVKVYLSLLLLVKYDDNRRLSLIALNLISFYLNNLRPSNEIDDQLIFKNYKKLFPKIIEMLDLEDDSSFINSLTSNGKSDSSKNAIKKIPNQLPAPVSSNIILPMYLYSPARILSDLCAQYPLLNDKIKDSNVDLKIVKKLEIQFKQSQLLKILKILKKNSKHGKVIVDFTILLSILNDEDNEIADLLLLLSVYTSTIDEYKTRVISDPNDIHKRNGIIQIVFDIVDNFNFLLSQIELIYKILKHKSSSSILQNDAPWFGRNLGMIMAIVDNPIHTNCLYFIRSLSRALKQMRTFFVECNSLKSTLNDDASKKTNGGLMSNLLQILKSFENIDIINNFLNNRYLKIDQDIDLVDKRSKFNQCQIINKSLILCLFANLVLEFSSFKPIIVNSNSFLPSLETIYRRHNNVDKRRVKYSISDIYRANTIQLNVLQILRSYMYNETNVNKKDVLSYFPLDEILLNTLYGLIFDDANESEHYINENNEDEDESTKKLLQELRHLKLKKKLRAFNIIRNYTAGSPNFNNNLIENYETLFIKKYPQYKLPSKWHEFLILNLTSINIFPERKKYDIEEKNIYDDEYLSRLLLNRDFVELIVEINYIEDNRYMSLQVIHKDLFPHEKLLKIWLRLLSFQISKKVSNKLSLNEKITVNDNLSEIKLSIVGIIVNLTWRHSTYSFKVHDTMSYRLFDSVQGSQLVVGTGTGVGSTTTGGGNNRRLLLEDTSEEVKGNETADKIEGSTPEKNADELTVKDRAEILQKYGFEDVIIRLITQSGKDSLGNNIHKSKHKGIIGIEDLKRFDVFNSHNLLEKLRTAESQISSLLYRGGQMVSSQSRMLKLSESGDCDSGSGRRLRGVGSSSVPTTATVGRFGPDVNRGGEGYGYGSDDEYGQDDDEEDDDANVEDYTDDDEEGEEDEEEDEEAVVDDDEEEEEEEANRRYLIS